MIARRDNSVMDWCGSTWVSSTEKGGEGSGQALASRGLSSQCLAATRGMDSFLEWIRWEAASSFFGQALSNSNQGEITMGRSLQNPKNNVLEQVFPLCSFPTVGTPLLVVQIGPTGLKQKCQSGVGSSLPLSSPFLPLFSTERHGSAGCGAGGRPSAQNVRGRAGIRGHSHFMHGCRPVSGHR